MDYLPVFFSLKGRACLVVGGGKVARRKIDLLLRAGARVTVVAPTLEATLNDLASAGQIVHLKEAFKPANLENNALVISATDDRAVNKQVAEAAMQGNLPVNVVDDPELSSFIFPSILDRSPIVIAISSGGKSPVLARLLKARLESVVPAAYGKLAELAGEFRDKVKTAFVDPESQRKFWEQSLQGKVATLFLAGKEAEARKAFEEALKADGGQPAHSGSVTFLRVSTKDSQLITLKGLHGLQGADVIVYDEPVLKETLDMARRDADRYVVGKKTGQLGCTKEEAPALVLQLAGEGQHVVRVKSSASGADAEAQRELEALAGSDVPFQVIPVTAT